MKITLDLKNCYGIRSLRTEFDFSKTNIFSIYASNGSMKTSFAKTFKDLSEGKDSKDEIYGEERPTKRDIRKNGSELDASEVFVIAPYQEHYRSEHVATLLIDSKLKKKCDDVYQEIRILKEDFLKKLNDLSGLKLKLRELESKICNVFTSGPNEFWSSLNKIKTRVLDSEEPKYKNVEYAILFNDKTEVAFKNKIVSGGLNNYTVKYNELIKESTFFKEGIFNHIQASNIADALEVNGFFKAGHAVLPNDGEPINTKADLIKKIEDEKNKILQDEELKNTFNKIDKTLNKNPSTRKLGGLLANNPQITSDLLNRSKLESDLFVGYFKEHKRQYQELLDAYENSKDIIKEIHTKAENEKGLWDEIVKKFNNRFFVPFRLSVGNRTDVIFENETNLAIRFQFDDTLQFDGGKDTKSVERDDLEKRILSQGERKALYILNILFEIEARKKQGTGCLLVIDDIADSFDYKNKYAIIEYLNDISKYDNFYLLILSHNFDFHRSVCSRLIENKNRENMLYATKIDGDVTIDERTLFLNYSPLKYWVEHLNDPMCLIASIPMVRNLFEFSKKEKEGEIKSITSFLHIDEHTKELKISDLKSPYKCFFNENDIKKINCNILNENFYKFLKNMCDEWQKKKDIKETETLEYKIVLSIAIRLLAEDFMIAETEDKGSINNIKSGQTFKLFQKYKELNLGNDEREEILERVILMTPANIHLNSFMYEPIIDMSADELRELYKDVRALQKDETPAANPPSYPTPIQPSLLL